MRKLLTLILVGSIVAIASCSSPVAHKTPPSTQTPQDVVVDQKQARDLADSIVEDILKDNRETLLSKMEVEAREYYRLSGLNEIVEKMFEAYGKPLSATYKRTKLDVKQAPEVMTNQCESFGT